MTTGKKCIAILINSLSIGGAERVVSNLSRQLADRYDIDIILNNAGQVDFPYKGHIISLEMPADKDRMGVFFQLKALFRRTKLLRELRKKRDYSAVLSFSEMTNLSNILTRDKGTGKNCRTIISYRNSIRKSNSKGWKYKLASAWILPYCLKRADRTVSCSCEIEDELITNYGLPKERSRVIWNGLDLEQIRHRSEDSIPENDMLWSDDGYHVICLGRLTAQKGQWHLIRAINRLRAEGMNVKLSLFGDGELRKKFENLTQKLKPGGGITLKGSVKNPFAYMARADAVVFPSLYEGFSNAIAETLACGVPCISTDHSSGAREILAPDTDFHKKVTNTIEYASYGVLVPVPDGIFHEADEPLTLEENLMADAIREILTNPERSSLYRESALQRAASLDIREITDQWISLIEEEMIPEQIK